jgi:hypothetical protein
VDKRVDLGFRMYNSDIWERGKGREENESTFRLGGGGGSGGHGDGGGVGRGSDSVDEAIRRRGRRGASDVVDDNSGAVQRAAELPSLTAPSRSDCQGL